MDDLINGWTYSGFCTDVFHFDHRPLAEMKERHDAAERTHVVETVQWSSANGDQEQCHYNKYFAHTLASAIAVAATLEIAAKMCAEEVIGIRPATEEEEESFHEARDCLGLNCCRAISDEEMI